mgnify:CR=1 FL=1
MTGNLSALIPCSLVPRADSMQYVWKAIEGQEMRKLTTAFAKTGRSRVLVSLCAFHPVAQLFSRGFST